MEAPYEPEGPYRRRTKGRRRCWEVAVLLDYARVEYHLKFLDSTLGPSSRPNRLHRHLRWLVEQAKKLTVVWTPLCPQCRERRITSIGVMGNSLRGFTMAPQHTCCDDLCCREQVVWSGSEVVHLLPFSLESTGWFSRRDDQRRFVALWLELCCLPNDLDQDTAFDILHRLPRGVQADIIPSG